jgi:hypothetical protein
MATLVTLELGRTFPSYTTLTNSVKLPAVPSTTAKDPYGLLFTKSVPEEIVIKSSAEAPIKPATSDVTRCAIKATKKARQRAAKYGHKKLLLAETTHEKQVALKKDPTDSKQLPTKSPPDGSHTQSSTAEATPQSFEEASTKSPRQEEAALQPSAVETALKTSV